MKRKEFLNELKKELKFYKKIDSEEIVYYYDEMIQDAVDEGKSEVEFIKNLGTIKDVVRGIVGDDQFISEVKHSNSNSLTGLITGTVKIIALFFYGLAIFISFTVSISIIIAGIAIAFQSVIYIYADTLVLADYLIIGGLVSLGTGIALIGFSIIKSTMKMSQSIKLYITRKTREFFRKKEVN